MPYVTIYLKKKSHTLQLEIYKEGLYRDCEDYITDCLFQPKSFIM